VFFRALDDKVDDSGVTKGRTASCTRIMSPGAADTAANAFATDAGDVATFDEFTFFSSNILRFGLQSLAKPGIHPFAKRRTLRDSRTGSNLRRCESGWAYPNSVNCLEGEDFFLWAPLAGAMPCPCPQPDDYNDLHGGESIR